jgi:polysaccharide export outer membrane protein
MVELSLLAGALAGQTPSQQTTSEAADDRSSTRVIAPDQLGSTRFEPEHYVLGPGDEISVWARDAEEISARPYRVGQDGTIRLPILGRLTVAGFNTAEVERDLLKLMDSYFFDPEIAVSVTDFRSQPVSIMGAVRNPGVIQLRGPTTIAEAISMAGGLAGNAGNTARLSRRLEEGAIPLETAKPDTSENYSVAIVNLGDIVNGTNRESNIELKPNDILMVDNAEMVYVLGQVNRAGGFVLEESHVSVLQAVAMAQGWTDGASPGSAVILRVVADRKMRHQLKVDLKKVMRGEEEDLMMQPNDILFLPGSGGKKLAMALLQTGTAVLTSVAVWRLGRSEN